MVYVQETMQSYSTRIHELRSIVTNMINAFHDIGRSIEESTLSITNVASDTNLLANSLSNIHIEMDECDKIVDHLHQAIHIFHKD